MKTFFFGIYFFFITLTTGLSQTIYTPNWESLDKRPIPTWFQNAKFGIFIHWGLYSVPAWSPKGTYAEWYQYWLDNKTLFGNGDFKGDEIYNYHQKIYGKDFTYMDFAPFFKAQDYNATEWADLFVKSGARYAVLTTKHHDGFALWDSKEASFHHRRPWNSMEIGAHRNLVEEFVKAIRKTPLKVGCYFSLREWNNPFYTTSTMPIYVEQHLYPQLKDLITKYKPDLIISDIMMPEMSGTEMCLKIKNNIDLCHIPIILLTALNSVEQNIEGLNRGADDYISKPFNPRILLARANNLVRNRLLIHNQIRKNPITEVDLTSINLLDQEILKKTSEAIEAHMDDTEFDIPELCKEIGVGRSVLYSKFKALTGMTPNNFILNYRLKFAATMLQKYPDIPVSEVGDKCGFSSPVYFSRCFKNQYGVTPQNYRKSSRNNSMEKGV